LIRKLFFLFIVLATLPAKADDLSDGAYLVHVSGCADCHTARESEPLAGGYAIPTPFGTFYSPNISPDQETGIGKWTEHDLQQAIRRGLSPEGSIYWPAFPYRSYTKMTDGDIHKIYLYLMSQPPIKKVNRPHELNIRLLWGQRWLMNFWQLLFFRGEPRNPLKRIKEGVDAFKPDPKKSAKWNRGAYIAESLIHCTECHTPRGALGQIEASQWMAGTENPLSGVAIPNITPDPTTGITWSEQDWLTFLSSGIMPDGKQVGDEMADVIRNTSRLTQEDREALIEYLRSLEPVMHYAK